jgi:hypothetical protein
MDTLIAIRARTVTARTQTLVMEAQNRILRPQKGPRSDNSKLYLSFMPFERMLLLELARTFLPRRKIEEIRELDGLDNKVAELFIRWQWTSDVMHQVLTDLHPEEVQRDHQGNQHEAFESAKIWLRLAKNGDLKDFDFRYQRVRQLVNENASFINRLGSIEVKNIDFFLDDQDKQYWRLLAYMVLDEFEIISNWRGFGEDFSEDEEEKEEEEEEDELGHPPGYHDNSGANTDQEAIVDEIPRQRLSPEEHLDAVRSLRMVTADAGTSDSAKEALDDERNRTAISEEQVSLHIEALLELENTWTIWQFCRKFWLLKRRLQNDLAIEEFTKLTCFTDHWKTSRVETGDNDGSFFLGYLPRKPFQGQRLVS